MGLLSTGSVAKYKEILAVSHNCAPVQMIEKYNESMFLKSAGLKFELASGPNLADIKFYRLNIVPR